MSNGRGTTRALVAGFALILGLWPVLHAEGPAVPAEKAAPPEQAVPPSEAAIQDLRSEAVAMRGFVKTPLGGKFLDAVELLPVIQPRTLLRDKDRTHYYTKDAAAKLDASTREALESVELDGAYYYTTRYGTPLAYARPLEIVAGAGLTDLDGKKIFDYGYGSIGHLKLMAALGSEVVGVEVDPLLQALYSQPGDQGPMKRAGGAAGKEGSVRLVHGQFPATPEIIKEVGEGYDLFISKNVLKNGYIHPAQPVDPRRLVHLGVDEATFVKEIARMLKPGGMALIYNLAPAPAPPDKPYIPWADGRCPFAPELWEKAGLKVIAFDQDDNQAARAMARALGWDKGEQPMDVEKDLFGTYTLVSKPAAP